MTSGPAGTGTSGPAATGTSGPAGTTDRVRPVPDPPPGTADGLGSLWFAVTEAGGGVDFVPGSPEVLVRDAARDLVAAVRAGRARMLVLVGDDGDLDRAAGEPDGTVFLIPGTGVTAHRAEVGRLMVRPALQGRGWGTVLLDAAVAHGADCGFEQLTLAARGGTGLPAFYRERGWSVTGVLPRGVRLSADDARDVHFFHRDLR